MKYYVTMTDKFMSGWGLSANKINKLILECDSYDEAIIVENNAKKRSEMKFISICRKKPSYPTEKYYVSFKTKTDYPMWYRKEDIQCNMNSLN